MTKRTLYFFYWPCSTISFNHPAVRLLHEIRAESVVMHGRTAKMLVGDGLSSYCVLQTRQKKSTEKMGRWTGESTNVRNVYRRKYIFAKQFI